MHKKSLSITEDTYVEFKNPRELDNLITYVRTAIGSDFEHQYEIEAIAAEFKEAINIKLSESGSDLTYCGAEIIGYALTEYTEPPAETVLRAMKAVDFWAITENHELPDEEIA